jgi:hypothetical protein
MPTYQIAHIKEQGQDVIIIPLDPNFEWQSQQAQINLRDELQLRATSAGLAGQVVVVWLKGGQTRFIAPPPWRPFFQSLPWSRIQQMLNRTLSW